MTWYAVTGTYGGALDEDRFAAVEAEAEAEAETIRELYVESAKSDGEDWQVFKLLHYCDPEDADGECACVQYATSHLPRFSSGEVRTDGTPI